MASSSLAIESNPRPPRRRRSACQTTFSKIGGLSHHINVLKEIIIMPLLHKDLYKQFSIKPPRGVIFYGPPGTGKTMVAGALATEISSQAGRKVVFYHRKGADVLDKWVGESERKLRELFDKAKKTRPSLIFFDELDGLAPERSTRNDQVHASVVTTLLALMDGLDDSSGVVIIGATNRIECVDPALRRPGRFDRELYFPLPNSTARQEILSVHTMSWRHKPNPKMLEELAEATCGCCGSDLQAICAEAVLCCLKRNYPDISQQMNLHIDLDNLKVSKEDFAQARLAIAPTMQRLGACRLRKLTSFIRPLLQRQVDEIVTHIKILLPHFLEVNKKYTNSGGRYAGRLLLKGSSQQGLNNHIIPALLQRFEHLQINMLDMPENYTRIISNAFQSTPSIIVMQRVDDWWDLLDNAAQMAIVGMLEDLHAGLPILVIVSYSKVMPVALHSHLVYNTSILFEIDDPNNVERGTFFAPLFFGKDSRSLLSLLHGGYIKEDGEIHEKERNVVIPYSHSASLAAIKASHPFRLPSGCVCKRLLPASCKPRTMDGYAYRQNHNCSRRRQRNLAVWLQSLKNQQSKSNVKLAVRAKEELQSNSTMLTTVEDLHINKSKAPKSADQQKIYNLWKRTMNISTAGLSTVHLELLYDALVASLLTNPNNFQEAYNTFVTTLSSFEKI